MVSTRQGQEYRKELNVFSWTPFQLFPLMFHLCMKVLINEVEHSEEVLTHITASAGAHSLRIHPWSSLQYTVLAVNYTALPLVILFIIIETLSESDCLLCLCFAFNNNMNHLYHTFGSWISWHQIYIAVKSMHNCCSSCKDLVITDELFWVQLWVWPAWLVSYNYSCAVSAQNKDLFEGSINDKDILF